MPASIGVNLRVTGHCRQGGRKYMEDFFSVAYQQTDDEKDLEYAFIGIYDGHGGAEAAAYAKDHLMETIIKHRSFWSDNDEDVLRAIKDGYIATHYNMWKEQEKWPKTNSGLPSTAGTTASIAFIRRGKIYIGHVGDSGIILGYQEPGCSNWQAKSLTVDHKPENPEEMSRIEQCGGKVVKKSGVPRVVWNRPRIGHQGPVRRSTHIDEIPFLAVARSLGDLWSYNSQLNQFIISPDPDCCVIPIDCTKHRCLIFGTDGLLNMVSPQTAVHIVQQAEEHNEEAALSDNSDKIWMNPSKILVESALEKWRSTKMRADNTSVVTLMLDPPGPPRAQVLENRKRMAYPNSGLKIMTRYGNENTDTACAKCNLKTEDDEQISTSNSSAEASTSECLPSTSGSFKSDPLLSFEQVWRPRKGYSITKTLPSVCLPIPSVEEFRDVKPFNSSPLCTSDNVDVSSSMCSVRETYFAIRTGENPCCESTKPSRDEDSIQIHEISSSSNDIDIIKEEPDSKDNNPTKKNTFSDRPGINPSETTHENFEVSEDEEPTVPDKDVSTLETRIGVLFVETEEPYENKALRPSSVPTRASPRIKKPTASSKKAEKQVSPTFKSSYSDSSFQVSTRNNILRKRSLSEPGVSCSEPPLKKSPRVETRQSLRISEATPPSVRKPTITRRLSLVQKIVKSKKILMKRNAVKEPMTKKKLELALEKAQDDPLIKRCLLGRNLRNPKQFNKKDEPKENVNQNVNSAETNQRGSSPSSSQIPTSSIYTRKGENRRIVRPKVFADFVPLLKLRRKRGPDSSKTRTRRPLQLQQPSITDRTRRTKRNFTKGK